MKVNLQNYSVNYPKCMPVFKGNSRELEKVLDGLQGRTSITAEEQMLIIEKVKKALPDILKPKRFIEEGSHNTVYKITSKYAARVPRGENLTPENLGDNFSWCKNIFREMRNYFGEAIVQVGKLQILKNIGYQIPAGIPEHMTSRFNIWKLREYYIEKYLPRFAVIPQNSYNELARDLARLNEMRFGSRMFGIFDSMNPNNIVTAKHQLFLVDEISTLCDRSYCNTTAKLLEVFIVRASKDIEAPDAGKNIRYVRKIFKKVIISGIHAGLIPANSKEDYTIWEKALKKCKINSAAYEILNGIEKIEGMQCGMEEKTGQASAYLNAILCRNPVNE